ncbi:hypothetical protein [Sinimarinibacterium thermocellulolyticum]
MLLSLGAGAHAEPPLDGNIGLAVGLEWGAPRPALYLSAWHGVRLAGQGADQVPQRPILRLGGGADADALGSAARTGAPATEDEDEGYSAWLYAGLVVSGLAVAALLAGGGDHSDEAGEFARDELVENNPPCQPIPGVCLP